MSEKTEWNTMPQITVFNTTDYACNNTRRLTAYINVYASSLLSVVRSETKQQINDWFISHCADVTEVTVSDGNLAENAPHYLSRPCLRQTRSFLDVVWLSEWTDFLSYCTITQYQTTWNSNIHQSTQPSTLHGMVKRVSAFGLINNKWLWWL